MLFLLVPPAVNAQTCPSVGQIQGLNGATNNGLLNGANVTIEVVGSTLQAGDTMVQNAANNWANVPSATYTFTIQNVNSVPSGNASASNPVIIFQIGPASDFAAGGPCSGAFMCTQPSSIDSAGHVVIGQIELNPANTVSNTFFQEAFDHELGHSAFGLADCDGCSQSQTIMASPATNSTDLGPTGCDDGYLQRDSNGAYGGSTGSGGPGSGCAIVPLGPGPITQAMASLAGGPVGELSCNGGGPGSPIIIDTEEEGFHLTSAQDGVSFHISGTGHPVQMAWTDSNYHNAFLALPGPDGLVHNGKELFGNFTPQPDSANPNGFIALAEYDLPENGGNGNGVIDEADRVFSQLRLWIDENHDGICQPNELHTLPEFGIHTLALNYVESMRKDQFGNQFRFKARVNAGPDEPVSDPGRWAYDVFFVTK